MANKSKQRGNSGPKQQRLQQSQNRQPGRQDEMVPEPVTIRDDYRGGNKLTGKVASLSGRSRLAKNASG